MTAADIIFGRRRAIRQSRLVEAIAIQGVVMLLLSLVLDCGVLLQAFMISVAAYWAGAVVFLARRSSFSANELLLLRLAWIPIAIAGMLVILLARTLYRV